ncbi:MAG: hypothetical protein QXO69_01070 [archaeon]
MEDLRRELDKLVEEKKALISALNENYEKYKTEKKARDANNAKVKEAKEKRERILDQVADVRSKLKRLDKELEKMSEGLGSYSQISKEYEELNWRYQTDVFSPAAEKKIVKRLDELERQLEQSKGFRDVKKEHYKMLKELRKLRDDASASHETVLLNAAESEKHHQELVRLFEEKDKLEKKLKEKNEKIAEVRAKLGEAIETTRRKRTEEKAAIEKEKKEIKDEQRKKLEEKAKEVFERFKKGEKVSLQELALLEEFGLY